MKTRVSTAALSPEVAQAIAEYRPKTASDTLWAAHGELVLARVRATCPQDPESARRLLSAGAGLLAFAERNHIPLTDAVLFSDEVIERYISTGVTGRDGTRATLRSRLRRLKNATKPARTPSIGHRRAKPPYTRVELAGLWAMVSNQPTPMRTRRLQGLYCLSLGAGCDSRDLRTVNGDSIVEKDGIVYVLIGEPRPRIVPVLSDASVVLLELATVAEGELLIGGDPDAPNRVNSLVRAATGGEDLPALDVSRLRHSWLVAMMSARIPLALLARLAGFSSLRVLEDLLPYTELAGVAADDPFDENRTGNPVFDGEVAEALGLPWL